MTLFNLCFGFPTLGAFKVYKGLYRAWHDVVILDLKTLENVKN